MKHHAVPRRAHAEGQLREVIGGEDLRQALGAAESVEAEAARRAFLADLEVVVVEVLADELLEPQRLQGPHVGHVDVPGVVRVERVTFRRPHPVTVEEFLGKAQLRDGDVAVHPREVRAAPAMAGRPALCEVHKQRRPLQLGH